MFFLCEQVYINIVLPLLQTSKALVMCHFYECLAFIKLLNCLSSDTYWYILLVGKNTWYKSDKKAIIYNLLSENWNLWLTQWLTIVNTKFSSTVNLDDSWLSGHVTTWDSMIVFLSPSRRIPEWCIALGCYRFLPHFHVLCNSLFFNHRIIRHIMGRNTENFVK